jgi:D-ribose pyranase
MEKKMKKGTVLNSDISSVISRLGHTDTLVVCDAGLPIPKSTTRIDMALTQGVPSFMQVLGVVTNEMQVEAAIIAEEIKQHNPQLHETLLTHLEQLQKHQGNTIEIRYGNVINIETFYMVINHENKNAPLWRKEASGVKFRPEYPVR